MKLFLHRQFFSNFKIRCSFKWLNVLMKSEQLGNADQRHRLGSGTQSISHWSQVKSTSQHVGVLSSELIQYS